ncbi:AAA family ATPase [Sorangium sp. So ce1036]|uniref:AAA family ATPase n=1 Tax=Sorangium sp. So ce1036 TaxID=3133328 RepID=UPI003F03E80C
MSRVLLIGLPGAGKSTLAARLRLPIFALDEIRREVSDGTPAGDYLARSHFLRACQERDEAVFEFNGAGTHRHAVRLALSMLPMPLRTVYLRVPADVALARAAARGARVPRPDYGVDPFAAFQAMHDVLEEDLAAGYWSGRPGWSALALDGAQPLEALIAVLRFP